MAPVEGRNVCSMFLTSCLAAAFGLKLLVFSKLYRVPSLSLVRHNSKLIKLSVVCGAVFFLMLAPQILLSQYTSLSVCRIQKYDFIR